MTAAKDTPDLETILRDLSALRKDVAGLAGHVTNGAVHATDEAVHGAAAQAGQSASHVYDALYSQGARAANALARQVEEQPITSLLLAFGLGVLGSQMLTRRGS